MTKESKRRLALAKNHDVSILTGLEKLVRDERESFKKVFNNEADDLAQGETHEVSVETTRKLIQGLLKISQKQAAINFLQKYSEDVGPDRMLRILTEIGYCYGVDLKTFQEQIELVVKLYLEARAGKNNCNPAWLRETLENFSFDAEDWIMRAEAGRPIFED